MKKKILVVDDSISVRGFFSDIFAKNGNFYPEFASNGADAVEKVKTSVGAGIPYDFVLTDINMPGMDGFETLDEIRKLDPGIMTGMITGFNIDDYIKLALEKGVFNIICKMDPPEEILKTINNLITHQGIFGIENYLEEKTPTVRRNIKNTNQIKAVVEEILAFAKSSLDEDKLYGLKTGLVEMGTNAVYHAYGYEKGSQVELKEGEEVVFEYGRDSSRLVVDIIDISGGLTKEKVLNQLNKGVNPTPEDLIASGGRGIYLTRFLCDKVIVNLELGKRTEVLLIMYLNREFQESKPLLINQM